MIKKISKSSIIDITEKVIVSSFFCQSWVVGGWGQKTITKHFDKKNIPYKQLDRQTDKAINNAENITLFAKEVVIITPILRAE